MSSATKLADKSAIRQAHDPALGHELGPNGAKSKDLQRIRKAHGTRLKA